MQIYCLGYSHSLHNALTLWNILLKLCRNVYNNGAIYNEQEPQLWLTYVLNYLLYN